MRTDISENLALHELSLQQYLHLSPSFCRSLRPLLEHLGSCFLSCFRLFLRLPDVVDCCITQIFRASVKVLLLCDGFVQFVAVRTHLCLHLIPPGFASLELFLCCHVLLGKLLFLRSQVRDLFLKAGYDSRLVIALEGMLLDAVRFLLQNLLKLPHPGRYVLSTAGMVLQIIIPGRAKVI